MPILGVLASAITGNLATPSYESIQTVTVSSNVSDIEFTSIPATYTHLQLRGQSIFSAGDWSTLMQFNSDTGNNYAFHALIGNGTTASVNGSATQSSILVEAYVVGHSTTAPFANVTDILDYKNTSKYKTSRTLSGIDRNGTGEVHLVSGLWQNTNAITSIKLTINDAQYFASGTKYALYGIKGA